AVGDAEFQKRCLGKLETIGSQGRTVLFVSHSMQLVSRLCERVLLMQSGTVVADGKARDVTRQYLNNEHDSPAERVWPHQSVAPGDNVVRLRSVRVLNEQGALVHTTDR